MAIKYIFYTVNLETVYGLNKQTGMLDLSESGKLDDVLYHFFFYKNHIKIYAAK